MRLLIQIVDFNQSNSRGVVYTGHNRGVVARLQISNNRRLASRSRSVAAVLNVADLIAGDNPADIVVCQSSLVAINAPVALCSSNLGLANASGIPCFVSSGPMARMMTRLASLNNKTTDHHMLAGLNKAAGADVTKT